MDATGTTPTKRPKRKNGITFWSWRTVLFKDILKSETSEAPKNQGFVDIDSVSDWQKVSLNELAVALEMHKDTVYRYIDLLEKSFIIVNVRGFSRNLRKEVSKTSRYYFYDNGVRNAIINNFNPLNLRDDIGQLWENYLVMERLKGSHMNHLDLIIIFGAHMTKKRLTGWRARRETIWI